MPRTQWRSRAEPGRTAAGGFIESTRAQFIHAMHASPRHARACAHVQDRESSGLDGRVVHLSTVMTNLRNAERVVESILPVDSMVVPVQVVVLKSLRCHLLVWLTVLQKVFQLCSLALEWRSHSTRSISKVCKCFCTHCLRLLAMEAMQLLYPGNHMMGGTRCVLYRAGLVHLHRRA